MKEVIEAIIDVLKTKKYEELSELEKNIANILIDNDYVNVWYDGYLK